MFSLANGQLICIAFNSSQGRRFLDGRTLYGDVVLRKEPFFGSNNNYRGTTWRVYQYERGIYGFESQGGGRRRWLNGKTLGGSVSLEDAKYDDPGGANLGGTRWKLHLLSNGRYLLESLGGAEHKYLGVNLTTGLIQLQKALTPEMAMDGWEPIQYHNELALFQHGTHGYHTYRIPSLAVSTKGTLLAFCEGRKNSASDTGDIDLLLKRSTDGGLTWQDTQVVWSDRDNTCGNPTSVVDVETSRIWLFMSHNLGKDTQKEIEEGTSDGVRSVWVTYSDDDGINWSKPKDVSAKVQFEGTRWDATGPGVGIQTHQGRLIIPANSRNIQSTDHGATWYRSKRMPEGTSEAQIVELDGGRLMRNARPTTTSLRQYRRRIVATSNDNGESWTKFSPEMALRMPIKHGGCQGSIIRATLSTEQGKNRILFSGPNHEEDRKKMTVHISYDEAQTWPISREIWEKFSAYSCLAILKDGSIGLLYEAGNTHYEEIRFTRFSLEWLTQNANETYDTHSGGS